MTTLTQEQINAGLTSFADVARTFGEQEDAKLFGLGLAIRSSIEAGLPKDSVLEVAGKETGKSKHKIEQLYTVGMVFGVEIADDFDWQTHVVCATAPGVDPADSKTYKEAYRWLQVAVDGYTVERKYKSGKVGKFTRKHTARTLRKAIASDNGNPKRVYLLRNVGATVFKPKPIGKAYSVELVEIVIQVRREDVEGWPDIFASPALVTILQPAPEVQLDEEAAA